MAQDIKLKNSMKKKTAKKQRTAALGNMRNIREKESTNMCENAFFTCLQEIYRMCRSTREEQNMDVMIR